MSEFIFKKEQLLVEYEKDPIQEGNDPNDVIAVKIINRGEEATVYEVGEEVLVRRGYVEEIKSPLFKANQKIIFNQEKVMCKYLR